MEYELAKRLKDAGFPFLHTGIPRNEICAHLFIEGGHLIADECQRIEVPTLEELIEACPKHRKDEYQTGWVFELSAREDGTWTAGYVDDNYGEMADELEEGATPTEAVAKLWLALNKKS